MPEAILVGKMWYVRVDELPVNFDVCPFCHSTKPWIVHGGDETFYPRRGCLDCNRWIDQVRLRK